MRSDGQSATRPPKVPPQGSGNRLIAVGGVGGSCRLRRYRVNYSFEVPPQRSGNPAGSNCLIVTCNMASELTPIFVGLHSVARHSTALTELVLFSPAPAPGPLPPGPA